jgi:hypothetical protein
MNLFNTQSYFKWAKQVIEEKLLAIWFWLKNNINNLYNKLIPKTIHAFRGR